VKTFLKETSSKEIGLLKDYKLAIKVTATPNDCNSRRGKAWENIKRDLQLGKYKNFRKFN
jgi:hypothetical protein